MKSLTGPIIKSLIFILVTVIATTLLAVTIINGTVSGGRHYNAIFSDVTSLNVGDDVRMAGVRVGQVTSIKIHDHREAQVGFSVQSDIRLARSAAATIRYRNLIGQRYIAVTQGDGSLADPLPANATLAHAQSALDLTMLFNGFRPLFKALSPSDVNTLSYEIIQVFQGEGPTVDNLFTETASLTSALASRDQVIGQVIDNLNTVLVDVNARSGQLTTLISTLQTFVSGLAQDRAALGTSLTGISNLSTSVASLLQQSRAPLQAAIESLGAVSANLANSGSILSQFLSTLPSKLSTIGRTASYGSWVNVYECSISGNIPVPDATNNDTSAYTGGVGAQPVATRCRP